MMLWWSNSRIFEEKKMPFSRRKMAIYFCNFPGFTTIFVVKIPVFQDFSKKYSFFVQELLSSVLCLWTCHSVYLLMKVSSNNGLWIFFINNECLGPFLADVLLQCRISISSFCSQTVWVFPGFQDVVATLFLFQKNLPSL